MPASMAYAFLSATGSLVVGDGVYVAGVENTRGLLQTGGSVCTGPVGAGHEFTLYLGCVDLGGRIEAEIFLSTISNCIFYFLF